MPQVNTDKIETFPYPEPYERLRWTRITKDDPTSWPPLNDYVWVHDRHFNIYPAVRTLRGLEVPKGFKEQIMRPSILKVHVLHIEPPVAWLPLDPDDFAKPGLYHV